MPGHQQYEVERILAVNYLQRKNKYYYLVKWKNWHINESTWEPQENLQYAKESIDEFEQMKDKEESFRWQDNFKLRAAWRIHNRSARSRKGCQTPITHHPTPKSISQKSKHNKEQLQNCKEKSHSSKPINFDSRNEPYQNNKQLSLSKQKAKHQKSKRNKIESYNYQFPDYDQFFPQSSMQAKKKMASFSKNQGLDQQDIKNQNLLQREVMAGYYQEQNQKPVAERMNKPPSQSHQTIQILSSGINSQREERYKLVSENILGQKQHRSISSKSVPKQQSAKSSSRGNKSNIKLQVAGQQFEVCRIKRTQNKGQITYLLYNTLNNQKQQKSSQEVSVLCPAKVIKFYENKTIFH